MTAWAPASWQVFFVLCAGRGLYLWLLRGARGQGEAPWGEGASGCSAGVFKEAEQSFAGGDGLSGQVQNQTEDRLGQAVARELAVAPFVLSWSKMDRTGGLWPVCCRMLSGKSGWFGSCIISLHFIKMEVSTCSFLGGTRFDSCLKKYWFLLLKSFKLNH